MKCDVAVVGLGIVGASAVYAVAWAGARVLALDAGTPGGGTSGSSFAWLNSVRKEPDVYHRLNAAGMTAHRDLSRELGGDAGYHEGGSLEWADDSDAERELRERVHRLCRPGHARVPRAARRGHPGRPRTRLTGGHLPPGSGARPGRARAGAPPPARRRRRTLARGRGRRHARGELGLARVAVGAAARAGGARVSRGAPAPDRRQPHRRAPHAGRPTHDRRSDPWP